MPAGEHIGGGTPPAVDIAVDPLDGTTLTAQGRSGAIAVSRGRLVDSLLHVAPRRDILCCGDIFLCAVDHQTGKRIRPVCLCSSSHVHYASRQMKCIRLCTIAVYSPQRAADVHTVCMRFWAASAASSVDLTSLS